MSASGIPKILTNVLEFGSSDDLNRMQEFIGAHLAYVFGYAHLATRDEDISAGAVETLATTTTDPLTAVVLNGVRFVPGTSVATATVTGGALVFADPDSVPDVDDSPIKLVVAQAITGLTLTGNASGSTRIDIIEVQRSETTTSEPRKLLNVDTEDGVEANVGKVSTAKIVARIRTGVAGSGWPGTASGWLPIAVASVPTGSTTWDTVTVWDVRPLLADYRPAVSMARYTEGDLVATDTSGVGTTLVFEGHAKAQLGSWVAGGAFKHSGADTIDGLTTSYLEAGIAWGITDIWGLWLAMPFGLPRWVRYTASGTRVPLGPRGIPILAKKLPTTQSGAPSTSLNLPTALGFAGAVTSNAVLMMTGTCGSGPTGPKPSIMSGLRCFRGNSNNATAGSGTPPSFTLTAGTHFSGAARRLRVRLTIVTTAWSGAGHATYEITVKDPLNAVGTLVKHGPVYIPSAAGTTHTIEVDIPVWSTWPLSGTTRVITVATNSAPTATFNSAACDAMVVEEDYNG